MNQMVQTRGTFLIRPKCPLLGRLYRKVPAKYMGIRPYLGICGSNGLTLYAEKLFLVIDLPLPIRTT